MVKSPGKNNICTDLSDFCFWSLSCFIACVTNLHDSSSCLQGSKVGWWQCCTSVVEFWRSETGGRVHAQLSSPSLQCLWKESPLTSVTHRNSRLCMWVEGSGDANQTQMSEDERSLWDHNLRMWDRPKWHLLCENESHRVLSFKRLPPTAPPAKGDRLRHVWGKTGACCHNLPQHSLTNVFQTGAKLDFVRLWRNCWRNHVGGILSDLQTCSLRSVI